jgi:hypothetical protein
MTTISEPATSPVEQSTPQVDKTAPKRWTFAIVAVVIIVALGTGFYSAVGIKVNQRPRTGGHCSQRSFVCSFAGRARDGGFRVYLDLIRDGNALLYPLFVGLLDVRR